MQTSNFFEKKSFNNAVLENQAYLKSFIKKRVWDREDVDDILQITLLESFKSAKNFRGDSHPRTWMCGVASKIISNYIRKKMRSNTEYVDNIETLYDSQATIENSLSDNYETVDLIKKATEEYESFPEEMKQVFNTIVTNGSSYEEASKEFNIPIGTVRSRVSRARKRVKQACHDHA